MKRPDIDYSMLPEHLRAGLQRYIEDGVKPGDFLCAVLRNDLMGAWGRADEYCKAQMNGIMDFVYNQMPAGSHGSEAELNLWIQMAVAAKD